jgi:glycosyltransferase involved in cell wall biosynthesis
MTCFDILSQSKGRPVLSATRRARICLITQLHVSMNPRLVKEADALAEAGYEVLVIAPDFSKPAREADADFSDRPWHVVASPQFGPDAPWLIRSRELVRRHAARILVRGGRLEYPFIIRAAWHSSTPDLVAAAKRVKADLYIAHLLAALPAAAIAARLHGARYAFDAEDFHLGDPPDGQAHELERRMTRCIEGRYLSGCAYVTAASPGIADAYKQTYGINQPATVLNVFPRAEAPRGPRHKGTAEPGPSVYWFSQTIGPNRGLECAVRAIGLARSRPHLYLRGILAAGFSDQLQILVNEAGVTDRVHVLSPAPSCEMARLAAVYDLGLSGETGHTPNRRIALTNKLFTYLLAGLPVVASRVASHVSFAAEAGSAVRLYTVDDADELATTLDGLLEDPQALAAARAAAFALGQKRYNWDIEKSVFLQRVAAALTGPTVT